MNWTVLRLTIDIAGFILVLRYGGFDVGSSSILLESSRLNETRPFKLVGGYMVVIGFAFQIVGALGH